MDWNWDGLERDEQTVLSLLSECHGGWTLDAAEGLCSDLVTTPLPTVLRSLTAKSMINPIRTTSGTRYRMLETVRLFGQQKLVDLELSEWAHRAHSAWYARSGYARLHSTSGCSGSRGSVSASTSSTTSTLHSIRQWRRTSSPTL